MKNGILPDVRVTRVEKSTIRLIPDARMTRGVWRVCFILAMT